MENEDKRQNMHPDEFEPEINKPAEFPAASDTPDEVPENIRIESEWAEKLGMDYDPDSIEAEPEPEPEKMPEPPFVAAEAPYVMPEAPYVMPVDAPMQNEAPRKPEPMPPTCLLWAVLATICCCLPAGIVAIIFSSQVSTRYYARDYEGARRASDRAQAWIIASIVLGIIINAIYMPLTMLMQ